MANFSVDSEKAMVAAEAAFVENFLKDLNNFKELMPSSVSNWESTSEHCTFKIPGMGTIGLKLRDHSPGRITMDSYGPVMFPYQLIIHVTSVGNGQSECYMTFEADVNPMLRMMIEKPIGNFFSYLGKSLQKKFEPSQG